MLGEQFDDLALDEGGVDVHDDEALGAAAEAALLDGDVDLLLGGLGGEGGAERVGSAPETSISMQVTGLDASRSMRSMLAPCAEMR